MLRQRNLTINGGLKRILLHSIWMFFLYILTLIVFFDCSGTIGDFSDGSSCYLINSMTMNNLELNNMFTWFDVGTNLGGNIRPFSQLENQYIVNLLMH